MGVCRTVYNLSKEIKEAWYTSLGVTISGYNIGKQLTELRKEFPWIKDVPAQTLQAVCERLDSTYQTFFRKYASGEIDKAKKKYIANRLKNGLEVSKKKLANFGKPKWAKKDEYVSMLFKQSNGRVKILRTSGNSINIPKLGYVKMFKDSEVIGDIKNAVIKKEPTGWFVYITCEISDDIPQKFISKNHAVGLDMGVAKFWVDSDGQSCENPKLTEKYERKLRIENRSLARKVQGSNSWKKQKKKLGKLHHKIKNIRRDFLHKESTKIAKENSKVYMEDLKVANMTTKCAPVKNANGTGYAHNGQAQKSGLNKAILDCGWGTFREMMKYKTNVVLVNPRYTSQKCPECGHTCADNRKAQEKFECVECQYKANADFVGAINVKVGGELMEQCQQDELVCV